MAWGRGVYDLSIEFGEHKKEGDGKAPAGLFYLGATFGDKAHQINTKIMPFLLVTDNLECVDDPNSIYYNQIVTANSSINCDWGSSEKMKEFGPLYATGVVIEHNTYPVEPGQGSAIFLHVWPKKGAGTAGCTTVREEDLNEIASWLDKKQYPCIVQLSMDEYVNKQMQWDLPKLR